LVRKAQGHTLDANGNQSLLVTVLAQTSTDVSLDSYLTDGTRLFRVVDVLSGQALLLEDASCDQLEWREIEELEELSLRLIVPARG
jgi:hypothetical protein